MIGTFILWFLIAGFIDTCIGNLILPGRVRVIKVVNFNERYPLYNVQKIQRIFFIPIKGWLAYRELEDRTMVAFEGIDSAKEFDKETAIRKAKIFSNRSDSRSKSRHVTDTVWDSKKVSKASVKDNKDNKEDILLLVPKLIEAVEKNDKPLELELLSKLNKLTT